MGSKSSNQWFRPYWPSRFQTDVWAEGYEVVAINDLTSPKMLAHLLKYDSSQGKYEHADEVSSTEDSIIVCGKEIKIYAFPDANNCPWGELQVDVCIRVLRLLYQQRESTGAYQCGRQKSCYLCSSRK